MDLNEASYWVLLDSLARSVIKCDPERSLDGDAVDVLKNLGLSGSYDLLRKDYQALLKELENALRQLKEHALSPGMVAALGMTLARIEQYLEGK
ncbi:MAG: hypothetical protein HYX82_04505 [Chloroflexi bacterium]|nr:hypothetical protein [Chloroflexota bacterium]